MQLKSLAKTTEALNNITSVLNTTYKTKKECEEALATIGQSYTTETLKSALAQSTLNKEQIKTILSANGLQGELLETTADELANAASTNAVAASQAGATGTTLGLGTAFEGLGIEIKKATLAMAKFLFTTPAGWATLAIGATLILIDILNVSVEEQREKLDDLKEGYSEIKFKLESLNSELSTTEQRMKELQSIESPTFVEKEEYNNLLKTNNELQRKIDLLELEERIKNQAVRKAFVATMEADTDLLKDKDDEYYYYTDFHSLYQTELRSGFSLFDRFSGLVQAVPEDELISIYEQYKKQLNELDEKYANDIENKTYKKTKKAIEKEMDNLSAYMQKKSDQWDTDSDGIQYIQNPTSEDDKAVNKWLDYIADYQDRMAIVVGGNNAKTNAFNRIVDNWHFDETVQELQDLGKQGQVTANMLNDPKYDEFINKLVFLGIIDSADNLNDIALAFNNAAKAADNFNSSSPDNADHSFSATIKSLDKFQSSVKSAADAYTKLLSGDYSSTDLLDSIQAINQAASDMKGTIAWEEIESLDELGDKIEEISQTYAKSVLSGAGIDIDSKLGQMLANIIQEAYESETAIASLNKQIDSMQDSYKDLTDIIETYNEHGYITFDQLQTLLSMEPQYLNCLINENGQLRMNQEAMRELAEQRLKDARAQIIEQTITELNELQFKKEKTAVDDARMAIEDIGDTLTSYEERLLEFIPIGELTTEEFIKLSNAINGATSNGVPDEDIDTAIQNAEKKLKFLKDMWNGEIGSMFGGFSSSKDTTKEFDWIEQAIENVEKEVKALDDVVNSTYSTFSQKNDALAKEISKVSEEIALQQKAYEEYMRKADSVGLGEDYKVLVRDGAINIENISDEDLQNKISDYQKWHEKAVAVSDAIKELNTDLKDLHVSAYELHTEDLKDRLDNGSLTEKQYLSELKAAYERFYGNLEEYAQQYHESVLNYLKQEKEYLNSVAGAAVSLVDTEIDSIRDNANSQEEQLKRQIELLEDRKKPLQDELDALEEKAKKENLILNLQKAQYAQAKAENQRTKLVNYMPDAIVI